MLNFNSETQIQLPDTAVLFCCQPGRNLYVCEMHWGLTKLYSDSVSNVSDSVRGCMRRRLQQVNVIYNIYNLAYDAKSFS